MAFHVTGIESKYDILSLYGLLDQGLEKDGRFVMYLPAFTLDPVTFREIALNMTRNPPAVRREKLDPKVGRLPCVVKLGMAEKMANFLFVAGIADRPGVLQKLDYRLTVISERLIYLTGYACLYVKSIANDYRPY